VTSDAAGTSGEVFDRRAERYDELRPVDDDWWEVYEALVRLGELRGARVVELGCGTGRLAHALEERSFARVWAVDPAAAMVERAKALGVNARIGRAELIPFKAGWFDAVVMQLVVHLVARPTVFAQARRVLFPAGRVVIAAADPAGRDPWFGPFFPSLPPLERQRRPTAELLERELAEAGFTDVRIERLVQPRSLSREHALDVIRSRAYSTFDFLSDEEYRQGLARAEAELPAQIDSTFHWLLLRATR
jgi:ubiquinone/menaquinone biosynthesis C-methylase UbiE